MICPNCAAENEDGRKFCGECGTRLAAPCPSCGTPNAPGLKFCGECGTALTDAVAGPATTTTTEAAPPAAERRLVSVLFADLVGFTTLAEKRDPEETRELLNRYFEAARAVIGRYGGTVEKFIGDAVMAVWGTPTAHEDDAERAVRAALELVDAVDALNTEPGAKLSLRAGVLTGEAAVSLGAEGQGMVAGDLVNTASRLQSVAPAGSVLVGASTHQAASGAIAFEPVGEQQLKGKQLPIAAWRALRVVAQVGGVGRAQAVEPPFVGREDELRLIKELLHATTREQRPRLISITGTAGIGKSRLAWELLKYVDGLVEDVYWHEGRSPAYGEGVTFWALGEMVRERARIAETDDDTLTREKLRAAMADYVPDETERRMIEPRLEGLLGLEPMPSGERDELFAAWRTFFERIAERGTTVLIFEDLHWADPGLLDFIEHLLEWARSAPILVITLARPELLDRRPTWGTRQRSFTALHLEPLGPEPMLQLVEGMVPGIPGKLVRRIVERAEGVPLYAVELVRMLIAEGRLAADDGRFRPAGDVDRLEVPTSLQALLAARLDALDAADRALLQTAAVMGQSFTRQALVSVSGVDQAVAQAALERLARSELIALDSDPRSPERGQYRFLQGLTREVAYGMLARPERRSRHVAAARYYEQLGDDELAGVLATHYLEAYRATPSGPEADALAAQARVALRAAADRAAALHSHEQAVSYVEQALSIAADDSERVQLWERAAESLEALARLESAEEYARRVLDWQRRNGSHEAIAEAVDRVGRIIVHGDPERGMKFLEEAINELGDQDHPAIADVTAELARAYLIVAGANAPLARTIEIADRALILAERHDRTATIIQGLITKGTALGVVGRLREGVALLQAAAGMAETEGLGSAHLRALGNLSFLQARDDPRASKASAESAVAEARRLGQPGWLTFLAGNAADAAWQIGDWDRALELAEESLVLRVGPASASAPSVASWIFAFRGQMEEAERIVQELQRDSAGPTDPQARQTRAVARSFQAFAVGRLDEAYAAAADAMPLTESAAYQASGWAVRYAFFAADAARLAEAAAVLRAVQDRGRVIDAFRSEVDAAEAALARRPADAAAVYRHAVRLWRELGMPFDLALTLFALAAVLGPDQGEGAAARAEATELLESLGAGQFAKRVEGWLPQVTSAVSKTAAPEAAPEATRTGAARGS